MASQEWRGHGRHPEAVLVGLVERVEAGVEPRPGVLRREDAHRRRQRRVERPHERRGGQQVAQRAARHLAEGVHAGVGAAGAVRHHPPAVDLRERGLEQLLY